MKYSDVNIKSLDNLFNQSILGILANVINGAIVMYMLRDFYTIPQLVTWYLILFGILVYRVVLKRQYVKSSANGLSDHLIQRYDLLFFISTLLSSSIWGSLGFILFPNSLSHQVFIAFVLAGMTAGATSIYASSKKNAYAFTLISCVPLMFSFLMYDSDIHYSMSFMTLVFIGFMIVSAKKGNEAFRNGLKLAEDLESSNLEREIAQQSLEFKTDFLAQMSHEIRTPLNGIVGSLEAYIKIEDTAKRKELFEIITSSSKGLLRIVNDVLNLSKIEEGKFVLNPVVFEIRTVIDHVASMYMNTAKEAGTNIVFNIEESLPEQIKLDELRLKQVLNNLVSNALKFTRNGEVRIKLNPVEGNDSLLSVQVIDNGEGIKEEDQLKIFDKYGQSNQINDRKKTGEMMGTGLGLTISNMLVKLMGGEGLQLESSYGEGSTFSFSIPYETVETQEEEVVNVPVENKERNILLVEDIKSNQIVGKILLESIGCKVSIASNGQEAIDMYAENPSFDVILMDIQMPVKDGIEATKELKSIYASNDLSPIVGLSAKAMEGDREKFMQEGMDDYITKPITIDAVQSVFKRVNV